MRSLGLDARMIHHTGIGTYIRGLLQGFGQRRIARDWELTCYGIPGSFRGIPFFNFQTRSFDSKIYSLAEQLRYAGVLKSCELWHAPHYNIPYFKGKTKLVVTVHDLIHWIYRKDFFTPKQAFYAGLMFRRVVDTADHIIAVSQNTARDLTRHFKADPKKISVIYESVGPDFRRQEVPQKFDEFKHRLQPPKKYFLYVGSLKPHKNVQTLLRVFRKLRRQGAIKNDLVIVGKKDRKYGAELRDLETLQSGGGIWYYPEMAREDLPGLYRAATALVHLSLYEGFGLTLLEAMACGTPVVASDRSSIPEIVGEAGILVDPLNESQIEEVLQDLEHNPVLCSQLQHKGEERLSYFSWENTARQTLDVYEKVLAR